MSTPLRTSYPVPVEDLIPAARRLAVELGEVPSQNRLMKHLRVGKDKAKAVHAALIEERTETRPETHLHSVPDTDEAGPVTETPEAAAGEVVETPAQVTPPGDPASVERPGWRKWSPRLRNRQSISPADDSAAETAAETDEDARLVRSWPVLLLALPAFVAVWSGWVGLGELTGFGVVHPLPGIADDFTINSAITLPIGVETYAAFALRVWLSGRVPARARRFAKVSALASLALGALGQVAYHLLDAQGVTAAPWPITTAVACLPVAVLGMGAALAHLIQTRENGSR
ncbi:ABC transporter permease [Kribbella sp. NPDC049174]|uniref:ABC transporter permease n=1 Tax=Kribbella sp. NPDC049174 TaxID=3364112 RepID=UPI00371BC120